METLGRLDATDLINIAIQRFSTSHAIRPGLGREYALAYEWGEAALAVAGRADSQNPELHRVITELLAQVRQEHDRSWRSSSDSPGNLPNEEFFIGKIGDGKRRSGRQLREAESRALAHQVLAGRDEGTAYHLHDFHALCRGEPINMNRSQAAAAGYSCYLTSLGRPAFVLAPLKLEVLSEQPSLYVFHEVLRPQVMKRMQDLVSSQLAAAEIQDVSKEDGTGSQVGMM